MVQREVAERVAAAPGDMTYLSVFVQYHARARVAFRVPRDAFEPAPKVESAVLVLEPYDTDDRLDAEAEDHLWRVVQAALPRAAQDAPQRAASASCRSRRSAWTPPSRPWGSTGDRRPQTVAVGEWIALAEALGPIPAGR